MDQIRDQNGPSCRPNEGPDQREMPESPISWTVHLTRCLGTPVFCFVRTSRLWNCSITNSGNTGPGVPGIGGDINTSSRRIVEMLAFHLRCYPHRSGTLISVARRTEGRRLGEGHTGAMQTAEVLERQDWVEHDTGTRPCASGVRHGFGRVEEIRWTGVCRVNAHSNGGDWAGRGLAAFSCFPYNSIGWSFKSSLVSNR